MKNISEVIKNVESWLRSQEESEENESLCSLGLLFCNSIYEKKMLLSTEKINNINKVLTSPIDLIDLSREELCALDKQVSNSNTENWKADAMEREVWSRFLGSIAISYAKENDLLTIAAVIRISSHLNLHGERMALATSFLLDQQQPEGYFGLFFEEINTLDDENQGHFLVRVTVDILWALAVKYTKSEGIELDVVSR